MFRSFFLDQKWFAWSIIGTIIILSATWYKVQLDVQINEWFGDFYNMIQDSLANPGKNTFEDLLKKLFTFAGIAGVYIVIAVLLGFFTKHYVFRWRTAMNDYYMQYWPKIRHIEGAAQRVQEDTMRFASIVEGLGIAFIRSIMTLIAFLPILWGLSEHVTELPWIGPVDQALVFIAIISAICGTVLLAVVGMKLPGLEYNNQMVEAAYRKELVLGEDHEEKAQPTTVKELFSNVRQNYFVLFKHYLYFDIAKWSYIQGTVIVPYIALGPTIVAGIITLGIMQQVIRAFGKVEDSFQFLVHSWSTIVELISIYKRLRAFEAKIQDNKEVTA